MHTHILYVCGYIVTCLARALGASGGAFGKPIQYTLNGLSVHVSFVCLKMHEVELWYIGALL